MKARPATAVAALVALVAVLLIARRDRDQETGAENPRYRLTRVVESTIAGTDAPASFRTKVSQREEPSTAGTHRPDTLKDFMMPEVFIDHLGLEAALAKLMETYREACRKSSETPLALTFDVPGGTPRAIQVRMKGKSFQSSVQMLAALSGMRVTRDKLNYHFVPYPKDGGPVKQKLPAPSDIGGRLAEQSAVSRADQSDPFATPVPIPGILEQLTAMGVTLDASTRLTADSTSGMLELETDNPADAAVISSLVRQAADEPRIVHQLQTKVLELAAGTDWNFPDLAAISDTEFQGIMRTLAQKNGTNLMTLPDMTVHGGQTSGSTREFIYPMNDGSNEAFETREVGTRMQITSDALGFGQDLSFNYTNTSGGIDPATGKPVFSKQNIATSGFSNDGFTKYVLQRHEDGSKTLVMVTTTQVDETGKPRK